MDDLLDVTRIARGKVRLHLDRIDLREEVRRTVEDHRAAFEAGEVVLAYEACAEPCWADADGSRVAQIVGNLLGNALKFTNRGGRVEIRVEREPPSRAALRVRDDGVGLASEVAGRLFEPFSQAPQTLERSRGGLGLGLAMVKGLVELHGGSVEVRSDGPGRGAEFLVRLPLAEAPAEPPRPGPPPLAPPHRVLVVDDNDDAVTTLKDVLELGGHDVRVARDGAGALSAAKHFRPEIVICDIGLPGMDGYAVARAMRADPELASAWLVAMSGYAAPDDVRRAHEAGFDRHVAKPATLERLQALVAEAPAPAPPACG